MYVCMYISTYTHTYTHICIQYIHIYIHTNQNLRTHMYAFPLLPTKVMLLWKPKF